MLVAKDRPLWSLTQGQRGRYAGAILAMALANLFIFCVPLISQGVIDGLLIDCTTAKASFLEHCFRTWGTEMGRAPTLALAALSVVILTALSGLFHYLRGRHGAMASEAIVRRIRDTLYQHLEALPCDYHDKANAGDLLQRCSSDVETVRVFLSNQVVEIAKALLLLISVLPILIWLNASMALISVMLFPPIMIFGFLFFRKVKELFLSSDEAEGAMTAVLQENLTGIRVVRAFARQEFECQKFGRESALYRDRDYTLLRWLAIYWSISDFMCLGQIGIVLVSGAYFMSQGLLSLGVLSAFLTYIGILIWPVRHLGRVLADAGKALVALERLNEILEAKIETSLGIKERTLEQCPSIEFDNVSFSFQDGSKVLDSLSFEIEAGETLAILGPTGAGKSTLIQLLLRLYDIDEGVIRLADRDIKSLSRRALRSQMGVVLQESFLYSRTIKENLAFGNSKLSLEALKGYAQMACIGESIEGFSDGYETAVGERGVTLSGGQRQRLALARALACKAPILILDDALSAVDSKTEGFIVQALEERRGRQTTIVISHRLSSVVHADRILVLEKGQAAQCGRHQDLLQEEGPYRRLWAIQGQIENQLQQDKDLLPTIMNGESHERNQSEHLQRTAS